MMHSALISKIEKANRYAREPDRVSISRLELEFAGDNSRYTLNLADGAWTCDCHFFATFGCCCHVFAMQKLLGVMLPLGARESLIEHLGAAEAARPEICPLV
jgi:hypothetical protein